MTTKTAINPWSWQDARGFTQAWRVDGPATIVYVSGQLPVDADGNLVGAGDFELQARQSFDNLTAVLGQAGASFTDVAKLTVYLTDISRLPDYGRSSPATCWASSRPPPLSRWPRSPCPA
ncbi:MAG: RidA family protein [Jatrophihabitantaceae bacterium]